MSDLIQLYATANIRVAELERENAALLTYKANTTIRITALEKENAMWVQTVDRLLKEAKS